MFLASRNVQNKTLKKKKILKLFLELFFNMLEARYKARDEIFLKKMENFSISYEILIMKMCMRQVCVFVDKNINVWMVR